MVPACNTVQQAENVYINILKLMACYKGKNIFFKLIIWKEISGNVNALVIIKHKHQHNPFILCISAVVMLLLCSRVWGWYEVCFW